MELEEYQKIALQRLNKSIAFDQKENMYYACMGIIEETGEIIAELRKTLFKGNFHEKALNIKEIESELGDLLWYISLICKNANIDMKELKNYEESNNKVLSQREKLIQISIKMGQYAGEIVDEYQKVYSNEKSNKELLQKIEKQFLSICELSKELDITIDEILDFNIKKVNSRYDAKGESTRGNIDKGANYEKEL